MASGQQITMALGVVADIVDDRLSMLDKLDRLESDVHELTLTTRLLCQAQGLETKGPPLVELIRDYTEPFEQARRERYWEQLAELVKRRQEIAEGADPMANYAVRCPDCGAHTRQITQDDGDRVLMCTNTASCERIVVAVVGDE